MAVAVELQRIPAFPPVVARLLSLLGDEEVSIRALAEAIQGDPGLSGTLLQRANSSLYGLAERIESVPRAIGVLGLSRVRKLALTLAAHSFVKSSLRTEEFRRCWRHTVAGAFLTSELAFAYAMREDIAYMTGLLHDIGRIGLMAGYPAEYAAVLRLAEERTYDVMDLEREHFGEDHCELGRRLAERWNLPDEIRVASGRHHDRPDASAPDLLYLVQLGCRLADALGYEAVKPLRAVTFEEIRLALPEQARQRFCHSAEQLQAALEYEIAIYLGTPAPERPALVLESDEEEQAGPAAPAGSGKEPADFSLIPVVLAVLLAALAVLASITLFR